MNYTTRIKKSNEGDTMNKFYFEVTDTFGYDLNYCWLHRYAIEAKNIRGALIKLSKHTGLKFRSNGSYYKAKNACIAAYELDQEIQQDWIDKAKNL
jgi:hypothetical protein